MNTALSSFSFTASQIMPAMAARPPQATMGLLNAAKRTVVPAPGFSM